MNELWTAEDVVAGLCSVLDVGSAKPQVPDTSSPTVAEDLDMAALIKAAHNHLGGESAFIEYAKKNPHVIYPAMLKMGVVQAAKLSPPALPDIAKLTAEDMEHYSTAEIKLMLLRAEGITTKDEADSALGYVPGVSVVK